MPGSDALRQQPRTPGGDGVPLKIEFDADFPVKMRAPITRLIQDIHSEFLSPAESAIVEKVTVEWAPDKDAFGKRVGRNPEHLAAAADASKSRMILNGEYFATSNPSDHRVTIAHEYIHLLIGKSGRFIPLWLEEGLAMHLSGDLDAVGSEWQLTFAHSFRRLVPLRELQSRFPDEPARRSLAYRQAYSLTSFILQRDYPVTGAKGLLEDLLHPSRGVRLEMWLDDRLAMYALETAWRKTLGNVWAWIAAIGSGTVFWGVVTGLFLYATYRRRLKTQEIERRWKEEEGWRDSVPKEEYGEEDE